jgi:alpha-D-xyloside xylohydrolase
LSNQEGEGGAYQEEHYDYFSLPLFVRPNSLLAIGSNTEKPDYAYNDQATFHLFALDDAKEAKASVHAHDGSELAVCKVRRSGSVYEVAVEGAMKNWALCLRNIDQVASVSAGKLSRTMQGIVVTFSSHEKECRIITA